MNYLVLHPDEDGVPFMIVSREELDEYLKSTPNLKAKTGIITDVQYWEHNEIMIFEISDPIVPVIKLSI